jgi:AbiV family abortive infection protein
LPHNGVPKLELGNARRRNMSKKGDWAVPINPQLRQNIEETARAAYENGCSLRQDATILFEAGRFPRAAALAVLAEEEFSKAFMLIISARQGRWDSNIFKALHKHPEKQGLSYAMRDYLDQFVAHSKRIMEIDRCALIPIPLSIYPSDEKMEAIISKAKSRIAKPIKDFLKQNCFYVSCDNRAKLICKPDSIGQKEAQSCLDESEQFKVITELSLNNYQKY